MLVVALSFQSHNFCSKHLKLQFSSCLSQACSHCMTLFCGLRGKKSHAHVLNEIGWHSRYATLSPSEARFTQDHAFTVQCEQNMRYHATYGTHNSRNLSQNVTTLHPLASASSLSISASTSAPVSLEDFQYFKLFDKRSCSPCVNMISQFEIFKLIWRSVLSDTQCI